MALTYHIGLRGVPGFLTYITGNDGVSRGTVIPAMALVDQTGAPVGGGSQASPTYTAPAPGTLARAKVTLAANTAATLFAANTAALGCRLLNWTASIVYLNDGTTGTPASGAPSDYIPAAASGVPGQFESPYPPTTGMRAVGASAGDITVETW